MHNVDICWGAMQSKKRATLLGLQCTFVCRLVSTPFDNWAGKMGIYVHTCVCVCVTTVLATHVLETMTHVYVMYS